LGGINSVENQLRALETQLWLVGNATTQRFSQIEHSLSSLRHAVLQQSQFIVVDLGGEPNLTLTKSDAAPSQTTSPEAIKHLSPRAREVYFQLRTAAALHVGKGT
jgi:hypothetical protein